MLKTVSGMKFPDAEKVSNAIAYLLGVVERYKLVGKWVSSVTIKEISDVSVRPTSRYIPNGGKDSCQSYKTP